MTGQCVWVPFLGAFVACFVPVLLFRWRRRTARRWEESGKLAGRSNGRPQTFARVWYFAAPPTPSWRAHGQRRVGSLAIDPAVRGATFSANDGIVTLADILDVGIGAYGNDPINTYVEVRYGDAMEPHVAYISDGRLFGLTNLLTGSNLHIARSFAALAV